MTKKLFLISTQSFVPCAKEVSLRIMLNQADSPKNSIHPNRKQTLSINSVTISIVMLEEWGDIKWNKFELDAATGEDNLALDINFMGNEFRINETDHVYLQSGEICFDLKSNESKKIEFWLKQSI